MNKNLVFTLHFKVLFMKEKPIDQLADIRNMMERSSKFISLSGLSGVSAGIIALAGAAFAFFALNYDQRYFNPDIYFTGDRSLIMTSTIYALMLDALIVLVLAIGSALFFTSQKAKKLGEKVWNNISKRMLYNLFVPLISGGAFCLALIFYGIIFLVAPAMLIFYGLALINAGKFTLKEIHYLGLSEIVMGVLGLIFIGYGLVFWAIGFGVLHIIYGVVMYYRYDR
jgi:hypothetical protein